MGNITLKIGRKMKTLLIVLILSTLTSCGNSKDDIDSNMTRYMDAQLGVVCYTIKDIHGVSCVESKQLAPKQ